MIFVFIKVISKCSELALLKASENPLNLKCL